MVVLYVLKHIFNKMNDQQFTKFWQKMIIEKPKRTISLLVFHYFIGVVIVANIILIGINNLYLSLFVYFFTMVGYGAIYTKKAFSLFAIFNQRYILNNHYSTEEFDKRNVVRNIYKDK